MLQTLKEASVPRSHPAEFRHKVLAPVEAGRPVRRIAHDLGASEQTIYVWRRQHLADTGQLPGPAGEDQAEPVAARRRIAELEAEPAVHRRAAELMGEVVPPGRERRPRPTSPPASETRVECPYRRGVEQLGSSLGS
ncbi:transposase [Streptomyces sp. YIM B13518]|uniref:transposase n=1 Tax=Streptomyces sp. YIM B13518 TaxID=3366316 RepID=UPI00368207CB